MKYKLLLILSICSGCEVFYNDIKSIDERIMPYYELFLEEGLSRNLDYSDVNVIIKFGELEGMNGVTTYKLTGQVEIIIDESTFNSRERFEPKRNEVTLFHELGHGILDRRHNDDCFSLMIPKDCNYMNLINNRETMLNELFGAEIQ